MKKIKDERLLLQNLKNIRLAFIIQTLGIAVILVYKLITEGVRDAAQSPLLLLVYIVGVVLLYQNLQISNEMEDKKTDPGPFYRVILIAIVAGVFASVLTYYFPGESTVSAMFVGVIVGVCFLIPFSIVYFMMKRQLKDKE